MLKNVDQLNFGSRQILSSIFPPLHWGQAHVWSALLMYYYTRSNKSVISHQQLPGEMPHRDPKSALGKPALRSTIHGEDTVRIKDSCVISLLALRQTPAFGTFDNTLMRVKRILMPNGTFLILNPFNKLYVVQKGCLCMWENGYVLSSNMNWPTLLLRRTNWQLAGPS